MLISSRFLSVAPLTVALDNSRVDKLIGTKNAKPLPGEPRKNLPTFHYTGWLIGILIMVYYNPYITG